MTDFLRIPDEDKMFADLDYTDDEIPYTIDPDDILYPSQEWIDAMMDKKIKEIIARKADND